LSISVKFHCFLLFLVLTKEEEKKISIFRVFFSMKSAISLRLCDVLLKASSMSTFKAGKFLGATTVTITQVSSFVVGGEDNSGGAGQNKPASHRSMQQRYYTIWLALGEYIESRW
jgi:hypothetical protein